MFVPFENPPDGGPSLYPEGHNWKVRGHRTVVEVDEETTEQEGPPDYSFERLTLTPSILRKDCGWHGFITNGEIA
jgi:hypothetical protein